MNEEARYLTFRRMFFSLFLIAFFVLAPIIVFLSLGYKFDFGTKKFQRTGAISISTTPKEAEIYLDGKKINEVTPCVLRELLPKKYTLTLEKNDFYAYKIPLEVKSSFVSEINVTLVPKMKHIEKLKLNLNIYKFFVIEHFFGREIIAFTDKGIYFLNEDFENAEKIIPLRIDEALLNTIEGIREDKEKLVFWNQNNIWLVNMSLAQAKEEMTTELIYSTKEMINNVFFGLKGKYLIIHDGMRVIAQDIKNYNVTFPVLELESVISKIFYDTASDTLYIKDKILPSDTFSLFKINLRELMRERTST